MAEDYGSGVSRTLTALQRAFTNVIWQKNKPPLDSELNLMAQLSNERLAEFVRSNMHSGFVTDPTQADTDFVTADSWSNFFKIGRQASGEQAPVLMANVHGWIVPITGTGVPDGDTSNRLNLFPPPASDARIDFVYLEVWRAQVAPNPATDNKPTAATVWKYGNTGFGGTNITDDIEDPNIGFETTERVQIQYALRVFGSGTGLGNSVALDVYPDGLDDPNVHGRAAASAPVGGFAFANMREELGDPGLWRAGDGDPSNDLGTVDGYVYAIPVAAVFRRNSEPFVAISSAGNANQNGAFDRNPSAIGLTNPQSGAKALVTATLTNDIGATTVGVVQLTDLIGSGIDDTNLSIPGTFLVIDDEIITFSAVDTGASPGTITIPASGGRGRNGTMAVPHHAGATVQFFNTRADGLFADQINGSDILDLRRSITSGDWDYQRLLLHNFTALIQGRMRSTWKQAGAGDTQGTVVVEVDSLLASGTVPNQTEALDGPDGIRQIWSDAAALQGDVTVMLDEDATQAAGFVTAGGFSTGVNWDIGADFQPSGFMNSGTNTWSNGSVFELHIGGSDGNSGARGTFRDSGERAVRFAAPHEFWLSDSDQSKGLQHPITLSFINNEAMHPAAGTQPLSEHPGPLYPRRASNFEKPFIALGGLVNSDLKVGSPVLYNVPEIEVELPGLNFDVVGDWWTQDTNGNFENDPSTVSKSLVDGRRTLWGMLTNDGADLTGSQSQLYLVLQGDIVTPGNNGAYQIIGVGTAGLTLSDATASDRVRVRAIRPDGSPATFPAVPGALTTSQVRSQFTNVEDGSGSAVQDSALMLVLTDMAGTDGGSDNPWNAGNLSTPIQSGTQTGKAVIRTTLQYAPGRAGMARRPDEMWRLALLDATEEYLNQAPSVLDSSFPSEAGTPNNETPYALNPLQSWNRLSGLGLDAPYAPAYGGNIVAFSEQDREAEAFFDAGSKTLLFRPMRNRLMTLKSQTLSADGTLTPTNYLGTHGGGFAIDGLGLYAGTRVVGFPLPPEVMPKFGRLDIPYYTDLDTSAAQPTFHQGINHLFVDTANDVSGDVFSIVGGNDNSGGSLGDVLPIVFQTGPTSGLLYGQSFALLGKSGYQARLYEDVRVQSSDVGRVLKGIQLPPFLGPSRIYAIYDRRDYVNAGGTTFQSNRLTPSAGAPPNLMRTDAKKQTLFIVEGGAEDVTGSALDHTYVVPENLIDITLSDSYTSGETFEDIEYVIECVVFGFARGWINQNHTVLLRTNSGGAVSNPEYSDGSDLTLESVRMVVPTAAALGDHVSVGYSRTPYQGDPFMTRDGNTRTNSDYENRYGQVAQADAFELGTAIQQFDSDGNLLVETPNKRPLQVLASLDFWTTFGTGKMGGPLYAGTVTDVGFSEDTPSGASRVPALSTSPRWRTNSRAFTEGQLDNPTRASVIFAVVDNASMTGAQFAIQKLDGTTETFIGVAAPSAVPTEFTVGANAVETAANIAARIVASTSPVREDVSAYSDGTSSVHVLARAPGAEGQSIRLLILDPAMALRIGTDLGTTATNLLGGNDLILNGGMGDSSLDLTGMTERLPLGILLQDSDFMSEDPLNSGSSAFGSALGSVNTQQIALPLTGNGQEYTRLVGGPGQWVGMADGGILRYAAYNQTSAPTGSRRYRLYRGASSFVLTDPNPGGPVDWVSGSYHPELNPVLKGGVLAGKVLLVRNYPEEAFAAPTTTSHGGEIQMVVLTRGILGKGRESVQGTGVNISGTISPTGYGEGYAASDRYRLEGKPMMIGVRDPLDVGDVDLATFPFDISVEVTC